MARIRKPDKRVVFGDTIEDTVVPDGLVRSRSKLAGVKRALDKMYGEGVWGIEEARRYVIQREWEKKIACDAAQRAGVGDTMALVPVASADEEPADLSVPIDDAEIEAAAQHILDTFPDLVETNRPMLRQREYYNRILPYLAAGILAALKSGDDTQLRQKQQIMTDLQREVRQIETTLGLDAGSLRSGGVDEVRGEVLIVMDRALAMLNKHAIRIACPACRAGKQERHINLGFLLYHFRQDAPWHLFVICPHPDCQQGIHIYGGPEQEPVTENTPKDVGPLRR